MVIFIGLTVSVLGYQIGKIDTLEVTFNHNLYGLKEDISEIRVDVGKIQTSLEYLIDRE